MGYNDWAPYVSVAERKRNAMEYAKKLKKQGKTLNPIQIEGRTIARTFWGKAWCDNLEAYSDYANRLPRGRTYARNGSIIDLQITEGKIKAQVMGSSLYKITIDIKKMTDPKWKSLVKSCAGKIDSLIELLLGKFSKSVMQIMTEKNSGLFPKPSEISMSCTCPDFAGLCKHIAAVFYGIGARLDTKPEWLFTLRHVDHTDLIKSVGMKNTLSHSDTTVEVISTSELSALFDIELTEEKPASINKQPKAKKPLKSPVKAKPSKAKPSKAKPAKKAALKSRS